MPGTITLTFCDSAENHVGMQKIGNIANIGFQLKDLCSAKNWFNNKGCDATIYDINWPLEESDIFPDDEAYILIAKNGVNFVLKNNNKDDFYVEQKNLKWDQKAFMYGRVVNKNARYNLCFGNQNLNVNYAKGQGTIVSFDQVPILNEFRQTLPNIIGDIASNMVVEGNYYYDITKCGIGFHGDGERLKVVGVRLGESIPIDYQWYKNNKPIGERMSFTLDHGDVYIMSEKATGNDWKRSSIYTLRHAAGCNKFRNL